MRGFVIIVFFVLTGCSSIPKAKLNYYLPETSILATVTRTVTCDSSDNIYVANSAKVEAVNSADLSAQQSISLSDFDSWYSDGEVTFEFYPDGRLKGANATSSGLAGQIIESGIDILTSKNPLFSGSAYTAECDLINRNMVDSNDKKIRTATLNLSYRGELAAFGSAPQPLVLLTVLDSRYDQLRQILGSPNVAGDLTANSGSRPLSYTGTQSHLTLRPVGRASITVGIAGGRTGFNSNSILTESVSVALDSEESYNVPIPDPAVFGSSEFSISLSDTGSIEEITYGSSSTASEIEGIVDSLPDASSKTTADLAAEVKAQADLIAQQTRLVRCEADPTSCTL